MKMLRSISFLLIASSMVCFVLAYDCYWREIKEQDALPFGEPPGTPWETSVGCLLGVFLLVAGVVCFLDYRKQRISGESAVSQSSSKDQMLKG